MARKKLLGCFARASRAARVSFCSGAISLSAAITTSIESRGLPFARGEAAKERDITFEEIEERQGNAGLPAHVVEDQVLRFAIEGLHAEENQEDGILAGVGEFVACDFFSRGAGDAELLFKLTGERGFGGFAGLHLAAGEFPFERVGL